LPTGVTFPLLINGINVASEYGVTYDRSMIIDQQGIIRYYGGSHSPHDWNAINDKIEELLNTTSINEAHLVSSKFDLKPNYPNPFNPQTNIPFTINQTQNVTLEVYDINGKLVRTIFNAPFAAGSYTASWNAQDNNARIVSSGVYFLRLQGERLSRTRQIVFIK